MNNIGCQKLIDEMSKELIAFRIVWMELQQKMWQRSYQKTFARYSNSNLEIEHQKNMFLRISFDKKMIEDAEELQRCLGELMGNPFISYEKLNLKDYEDHKVVLEWVNSEKYDWLDKMVEETSADRDIYYHNWQFGQFWYNGFVYEEEEKEKVKKLEK